MVSGSMCPCHPNRAARAELRVKRAIHIRKLTKAQIVLNCGHIHSIRTQKIHGTFLLVKSVGQSVVRFFKNIPHFLQAQLRSKISTS
jgi:hypothetical protein